MYLRKNLKAFTLAEVLITLGIISVVAALTIPALIQSYKKQVATVRLKKFYSTMEQAIKLSEIDNGPVESWKKERNEYYAVGGSSADEDEKAEAFAKDRNHVITFYKTYIKPYLRVVNEDFAYNNSDRTILIYLSDGSTVSMNNGGCTDFRFDINGKKTPNKYGSDIFYFLICPTESSKWGFSDNQPLKPYVLRSDITDNGSISRKKLLEQCKKDSAMCAGLLMYDNFEFKNDYPYKL